MGETQIVFGAGLHRAGDVDEQQRFARPHPALKARELDDFAVIAGRVAQRAPQVDDGALPCPRAPVAHPLRQTPSGFAPQAAQSFTRFHRAKAALNKRFGASRGLTGFIRFFGADRFVRPAPVFLDANHILLFTLRQVLPFRPEEMHVEQRMIGGVTLGRRGQGRETCATDIIRIARSQEDDRREERLRLLRRDGKAIGPQDRDKTDERFDSARRRSDLAHATNSASMASRRPET